MLMQKIKDKIMNNDKIIFTYNQVDFIIKAQRFGIYFSYSDGKGLSFIREYILRLLKLTYCQRKQISDYFQLSKKETEIILDDLLGRVEHYNLSQI